jgi:hypothetical protein
MKKDEASRNPVARLRWVLATMLALIALCPSLARAQVPARFYWKTLSNGNAIPLIVNSLSGNTNPFDPSHFVTADADVDAVLGLVGYARTFSLFDRAAVAAILLPVGHVSGEVTVAGRSFDQSSNGFGDPMIELTVNVLGPPAQKDIPDTVRYEPGFSLDLLADLAFPIGDYDDDQPLNLGQQRWYGRLGAPIVWQLGAWVPGRRTTVECLPAVWFFEDNDNYVGQKLETDPMFQLDAHVTRDLTEHFWGSLDSSWYYGGKSSIDGVSGDKLNNFGVGLTLGYQLNDNLNFTVGYKSTVDDNGSDDLRMDSFMASIVFGWHPLVEGSKRLEEAK